MLNFKVMKKNVLLGLAAFVFAITAAVASHSANPIQHGYIDAQGACKQTSVRCNGVNQTCRFDVPEDPGTALRNVVDYNGCTSLKMP